MLIFYLERHERLFRGLFEIQTENEKIENFGPKPWTNHFGEIQILPLFNLTFDRLKRLISYWNIMKDFHGPIYSKKRE